MTKFDKKEITLQQVIGITLTPKPLADKAGISTHEGELGQLGLPSSFFFFLSFFLSYALNIKSYEISTILKHVIDKQHYRITVILVLN